MKKVLKGLIGGVAPVLASALGGPLAGTAVRALAEKLGLDPSTIQDADTLEDKLVEKIEKATAEDWRAIKQAEQEFKLEMRRLDISEEQIHQMDRESARRRQVDADDRTPDVLAYLIFGAFLVVITGEFYLLFREVEINEQALRLVDVTLGMLLVLVTGVKNYYFGSSAGSKMKTMMMGK